MHSGILLQRMPLQADDFVLHLRHSLLELVPYQLPSIASRVISSTWCRFSGTVRYFFVACKWNDT
ncbi:hypothetical protein KIN20_023773 [Parelaphostrongylus tenuis]|uniref:Uncharacterized protein n=1 Tax=Parelaphostrongylus tenuis TaxID=148309 RepID=A0AAD5N9E9_PARTN|nr:hypothetical protein KIN20_023773 [Parelaphostrongylus tenuis]